MHKGKVYLMCPYLDGSREGAVCNVAGVLLRNIKNIDLKICMGRQFESCHIYFSKLQEMSNTSTPSDSKRNYL